MDQPVYRFDNSFADLPERFYVRMPPAPVKAPGLVKVNHRLADLMGLDADALETPEGLEILGGNRVPAGADPLAMVYAGHQFGGWSPQLGDGRAILLGELVGTDGVRRDLQLKGAGRTPFSRGGDGRAALGPVLREYLVSEAMHAFSIPTTRALAAVTTGQPVVRETMLKGAILARVAESHIRVGTFQFFASQQDNEGLDALVNYVLARHYPEIEPDQNRFIALLDAVVDRQARLIAQWLAVGFIHGVMNTDNMSINGETIDYGPCAFMDTYHPGRVYSSIDHQGRYAYANQPHIAQWNLTKLAQCFLPLIDTDIDKAIQKAQASIDLFPDLFQPALADAFRPKLGLLSPKDGDLALAQDLLKLAADGEADFTLTFRGLADLLAGGEGPRQQFNNPRTFDDWVETWKARLQQEESLDAAIAAMNAANPVYIPRNHLVEEALDAAETKGDLAPFEALLEVLQKPFEKQQDRERYTLPPRPDEIVHQTFCGT